MTENKRFTAEFDKQYSRFYDNGEEITKIEVVLLLNKLHEENIRLKRDFDSCSHNWALMYDEAKEKVEELSKENNELKAEIEKLLYSIDKIIQNETQIAENIESTIERDYVKAVNRLTITAFENLKKELNDD